MIDGDLTAAAVWAQPLLAAVGREMQVNTGHAGLLVTVTQVGYAAGIFLLVPLGDTLNRRRLIPGIMMCSAVALVASALAPDFGLLLVALGGVGVTTVAGQLLIPLAGDLAREDQRGRVVGTVVSGVLSGILASRTISGLVADAFGWRMVYVLAATITFIMAILLARVLPALPQRAPVPYGQLLRSVIASVRARCDVDTVRADRRSFDRCRASAMNVLNQTRLFSVDPTARSRLNTAFVTSNFIGGAVGSMLASVLWEGGGWLAVTAGGAVLIGVAFVVWLAQRNRALTLRGSVPSGSQ